MNTVHRLWLADVVYPEDHPRSGVGPVYAFAVATDAGAVLVDTGLGPPHPLIDRLYRPTRHDFDPALEAAGVDRSSIVAIVNTHLHFDHCGDNRAFPGVPVWVQAAEREAARQPNFTIPELVEAPSIEYRLVDGEAAVVSGVRIVPAPGHTPGHQCVAIEQDGGVELIAGQAFETIDEFLAARAAGSIASQYPALAPLLPRLTRLHVSHDHRTWDASGD